ncbi:hypothetical protein GIB67_038519 [Kingdonia uniflora]|uniref:Rhodanese domain-containing protein n=1 Tax=Kingdonia uniflora TaxID=39325 RepID=A0A7J7NPY3_9MAGN|nr:hypothetical protein GIB67_038519 [Kingdonia uniflora]
MDTKCGLTKAGTKLAWGLVPYILWSLWTARNQRCFQQWQSSVFGVLHEAFIFHTHFQEASSLRLSHNASAVGMTNISKSLHLIGWDAPDLGWIKLSFDASLTTKGACIGGVLINAQGRYLSSYGGSVGQYTITVAECWALWFGIKICAEHQYSKVYIEGDSHTVIAALGKGEPILWRIKQMIIDIQERLSAASIRWQAKHKHREWLRGQQNSFLRVLANSDCYIYSKNIPIFVVRERELQHQGLAKLSSYYFALFTLSSPSHSMVAMEIGFRAATTAKARPPPSTPSRTSPRACSLPQKTTTASRQQPPITISIPTATATASSTVLSLGVLSTSPNDANAFSLSKDQIITSLTQVESAIDEVQEKGSGFLDFSQHAFQVVIDVVKPGFEFTLPLLQKAGGEVLKIASPLVSEASKKAQETIQSSGIDTEPVVTAAKTVVGAAQGATKLIEDAQPIASSTAETITSADPIVIVGTVGAIFLTYLLLPPVWSTISFNLRGYKGKLTPAQTLDLASTKNYLMIDIRSEKDKNKAGIPRLPSSAKNNVISVPLEELPSKTRSIVRNTKKVEAEIAALKISYLKKLNIGSNIVIMDSYADTAKIVAKALTSLGFKNCWIMADGFSGGRGWLQSRLGIESYNLSFAEVLSPSRVIPTAARRFGTNSSTGLQSSRKFLPGSTE